MLLSHQYQYSNGGASVYFNAITKALGNKYDFSIISENNAKNKHSYFEFSKEGFNPKYKNFIHKVILYFYENLTYFKIFKII